MGGGSGSQTSVASQSLGAVKSQIAGSRLSEPVGLRWDQECAFRTNSWVMLKLFLLVGVPYFENHWLGKAREPGMPFHNRFRTGNTVNLANMEWRWLF